MMTIKSRTVKGAQFLHQNTDRPAVSDNVMQGQQQHMLFVCQLQQLTTDQRSLGKIEGRLCLDSSKFGDPLEM
ncbi:hypothetical protein Xedl_02326 [Xenorhabdus eapokensis]|uniref:Uncharacterized protein n=1 Tax=Xenorhabdus eapokensis TaxID=1873482 RepID=A0A1Q5TQA3_9GAMM|nr:hypothetical protein Xedl_02326 [Xenorhabdus eapokensis]